MEDSRLKLLPLLEHLNQCAKRVMATHSTLGRNCAILWFIEECAFTEERLLFLYSEWKKKLPFYEDKDVDYDEWIEKFRSIFPPSNADLKVENFSFTYLARKLGATNLRGKDIQKLYIEQIYVSNGFDSSSLQTIEHLNNTALSYSICSDALIAIIDILKKIKNLLMYPTHDQYMELGRDLMIEHISKTKGVKIAELETNTPSDEYFSVMDSEIKRIHTFYKDKGLSALWLKKMDKGTGSITQEVCLGKYFFLCGLNGMNRKLNNLWKIIATSY